MTFFLGLGLGVVVTIGTAFIFAADRNILDEDEDNWYT
jgi:hypothetical protein